MLLIQTALHWEAAPFIRHLRLKKDLSVTSHELFRKGDVLLIVSGMGRLKAAIAATALVTSCKDLSSAVLLNIGMAGGQKAELIGSAFLAHKVIDRVSQKSYFPELTLKSPFQTRTVETFEQAVTDPSELTEEGSLCDMEAAGFLAAALSFVSTSQVHVIKIVSDQLTCGVLSEEIVRGLLQPHLDKIMSFGENSQLLLEEAQGEKQILSNQDEELLSHFSLNFRLTVAQRRILRETAIRFRTRSEASLDILERLSSSGTHGKDERQRIVHEAQALLTQS